MSLQRHLIFWALAFSLFLIFIFIFKAVLLPFVLGMTVAYLLNPLVNKMGEVGLGREPSALIILGVFFMVVLAALGALLPIFYREMIELLDAAPGYVEAFFVFAEPLSQKLQGSLGIENGDDLKAMAVRHAGSALRAGQHVAESLAAGGQAFISIVSVLVIMPIVAYFMMKEWLHITKWISDLMPRHSEKTIHKLLREIDTKLSGFVRGQIIVALMLGVIYALALSFIGLKYGFLIGLSAGLLSIIPMVGSAVGLIVGIVVAWFQTGEFGFVGIVAAIFIVGQIIEGNILTPKLVGDRVGLHPLWVFFALMAGGALFGILGMLLAVPVAAVASVLIAFAIARYKASSYYEIKKEANINKKAVPEKKSKKADK